MMTHADNQRRYRHKHGSEYRLRETERMRRAREGVYGIKEYLRERTSALEAERARVLAQLEEIEGSTV